MAFFEQQAELQPGEDTDPKLFPESITRPADQLVRMYAAAKSIVVRKAGPDQYQGAEAGNKAEDAQRASARAVARSMLTFAYEALAGELLQGEMSLAQLDPSRDNVAGIRAVQEVKRAYVGI